VRNLVASRLGTSVVAIIAKKAKVLYLGDMTRIDGGSAAQFNPFAQTIHPASKGAGNVETVGAQVQKVLFGNVIPPILDPALFPHIKEQLKILHRYRKRLANMAGDSEDDYEVVLADGTIAMIDADGTIYVGAQFLEAVGNQPEVYVGVLAHEIGHRPKRWHTYRTRKELTYEELQMLCRHEETRADIFAGKALAEMGMSCEPLNEFLKSVQKGPHPSYFSAEVRAQVISNAHEGRAYRAKARRDLFPEFHRAKSPKGHLGDY